MCRQINSIASLDYIMFRNDDDDGDDDGGDFMNWMPIQ